MPDLKALGLFRYSQTFCISVSKKKLDLAALSVIPKEFLLSSSFMLTASK